MDKRVLIDHMKSSLDAACALVQRDGSLTFAAVHFALNDEWFFAPMIFQSDADKNQKMFAANQFLKSKQVEAAFFVSESWIVETSVDEYKNGKGLAPSQHPRRREAIVIFGVIPGSNCGLMRCFSRHGGAVIFDETTKELGSAAESYCKIFDGLFDAGYAGSA